MKEIVNCGVLGAGWWSTTAHLPALKAKSKARIVAVQERDRKAAEGAGRDFGAERAVVSVEGMVEFHPKRGEVKVYNNLVDLVLGNAIRRQTRMALR